MSICVRNISVGLDLSDPIGQYNNESLLFIVRRKYNNRCYNGCLIMNVEEIVRKGECIINQLVGVGTPSMILSVTAMVFPIDHVIVGCRIINVNERAGTITCTSEHASIILKREKMFSSLKPDQYINVQVKAAKYSISASQVSISGTVYLPQKLRPIYKLVGGRTEINGLLDDVKRQIESELAKSKTADAKSLAVFSKLIAAYATPQKPNAKTIGIADFALTDATYVSRDAKLDLMTPVCVVMSADEATAAAVPILDASFAEIMISLYTDYYNSLRIVNEMLQVYNTAEIIQDHANLWNIYKLKKAE